MDNRRFGEDSVEGSARGLDAFSEEQPTTAAPDSTRQTEADGEAVVKIVITDEQIASSWEMFPSESPHDKARDRLERPILQEHDAFRAPPLATAAATAPQNARRSGMAASGWFVALFALVLIAGTIMRELEGSRRAVNVGTHEPVTAKVDGAPPLSEPVATVPGDASATASITERRAEDSTPNRVVAPPENPQLGRQPAAERRPVAPTAGVESLPETGLTAVPASSASGDAPGSQAPVPPAAAVASAPAGDRAAPVREEAPRTAEPAAASLPVTAGSAAQPVPSPETRAVAQALNRYQQAFSTLDANAAQAVWPSVDVKALGRAFDQLDQQTFELQACQITIAGSRAEAACSGTASYVRKVGSKGVRAEPRQWRFTLRQDDNEWIIDRVDVR